MSEDNIIKITAAEILETATNLKRDGYDMLVTVLGVDKTDSIEVAYHFTNTGTSNEVFVKAQLEKNNPQIASLSSLYRSANWHERETFDLLGVKFNNHPDLRRILLPNDWIGYPLRKDYKMEDERLEWNKR